MNKTQWHPSRDKLTRREVPTIHRGRGWSSVVSRDATVPSLAERTAVMAKLTSPQSPGEWGSSPRRHGELSCFPPSSKTKAGEPHGKDGTAGTVLGAVSHPRGVENRNG